MILARLILVLNHTCMAAKEFGYKELRPKQELASCE